MCRALARPPTTRWTSTLNKFGLPQRTVDPVFEHIVHPELYAGIEFAADGQAKRWFPLKHSDEMVLDPEISFVKPVLTGTA